MREFREFWLGVVIGNSRSHWGWFQGQQLITTWDTPHPTAQEIEQQQWCAQLQLSQKNLPVAIASVVPQETQLWQNHYPHVQVITPADVPIEDTYPGFGLDRALALSAAQLPALVIDAGTALTLTGALPGSLHPRLVGGAIIPGLQLQSQALAKGTAALPYLKSLTSSTPRWARDTGGAIASGILYTLTGGLRDFVADWLAQFPGSTIICTGGDAPLLLKLLADQSIIYDPHLLLRGLAIAKYRRGMF